jgi:hypothetical protein
MGRLQWFKQAIEKIYIPQFVKGGDDSGDGGNGVNRTLKGNGVLKINFDGTVETVANMSRIYSKRGFWQVVVRR